MMTIHVSFAWIAMDIYAILTAGAIVAVLRYWKEQERADSATARWQEISAHAAFVAYCPKELVPLGRDMLRSYLDAHGVHMVDETTKTPPREDDAGMRVM
jgi:hypothetical protein